MYIGTMFGEEYYKAMTHQQFIGVHYNHDLCSFGLPKSINWQPVNKLW